MTLREFFQITRPLVVIDCETSGLNPDKDRICEIGLQVHYHDERPLLEWRTLIDPGIIMPKEVTDVHRIRNEDIKLCARCSREPLSHPSVQCLEFHAWPRFDQIATNLARGLTDVDFAGKNVRFDLRFLAAEMYRAKVSWSYIGARVVDAERIESLGEPRTLSDLYRKHLKRDPKDAHQALADVRMTTEILEAQVIKYKMPRSLDELHELQWPGWIDPEGKFKYNAQGEPCFSNWGKHANKRMQDVAPDYWDFIISKDFSPEIKSLATNAKLGKFPPRRTT